MLAFQNQIIDLLMEHRIIVVVGETGSGKTTQIPQFLLDSEKFTCLLNDILQKSEPAPDAKASEEEAKDAPATEADKASKEAADGAGDPKPTPAAEEKPSEEKPAAKKKGRKLRIAITQPRRVAAIAMARRVSQERGTRLGDVVGYTIRFEDRSNLNTRLRYMTDGCLLRECLGDELLSSYDVVVLDEAHERSLHTDVLFALMKRAVAARQGSLRVLVTSATLDTGAFSAYFNNCPVLEVPGRNFKVDMHYHPVSKTQRVEAAVNVALNLHVREGPGHILVFLTGMEECEQAVNLANAKLHDLVESGKEVSDCLIVPLYGMMQSDDQRNVFEEVPDGCRKLVFSTNIAETSLTVAGVGFVVDCGHCKQKNYNPKTGMESLAVVEVSQVQAKQRAGRAGRTQDGKCFRLYSEETFEKTFPKVTVPEILRSNLASVCLQMKAMGIEDVVNFDFMEPPDRVRLVKSLRILFLLGALDADGVLTGLGKRMAQLPLEPQYSRCLLAAGELGCAGEMLTLVAILSSEGIWFRPSRQNAELVAAANAAHSKFMHRLGDHLTLVNAYRYWEQFGCSAEWCKTHYMHQRALRQAHEIRSQLCDQLEKVADVPIREAAVTGKRRKMEDHAKPLKEEQDDALLKALCAGFFMQSARICSAGGGWLIIGENVLVKLEGSSALDGSTAEWVVYTDLVGNTVANCMMRTASAVEHEWLRPYLPRLAEVDLRRLVGDNSALPTKKVKVVQEKDPKEAAQIRETKVSSARERYLARKKT